MLLALVIGFASDLGGRQLLELIDAGFGGGLGGLALVLLPAFTLAAAVSGSGASASERAAVALAPLAGAGMACPDTAYATLSPLAGTRRLSLLFGSYAGFKLLVPAGPAIVAAGLGGFDGRLAVAAVPAFLAAWATGLVFAARFEGARRQEAHADPKADRSRVLRPLLVLVAVLVLGLVLQHTVELPPLLGFLLGPKGAVTAAALVALLPLDAPGRAKAVDSGLRRTAPLLLMIGCASALGAVLAQVLPVGRLAEALVSTGLVLPALFCFTAIFKTVKGSSMATFAGTSGIVAALLPALHVSREAAALAMCAGAFVCITPNDSLYWLVRNDALTDQPERSALRVLALGSSLQGIAALVVVVVLQHFGFI